MDETRVIVYNVVEVVLALEPMGSSQPASSQRCTALCSVCLFSLSLQKLYFRGVRAHAARRPRNDR